MAAVVMSAALIFGGVDGGIGPAGPWGGNELAPAVRVVEGVCVGDPGVCFSSTTAPPPIWPTEYGPCSEWAPVAFAVGWPPEQWPTISRVMWCESKCKPTARNRSGAVGLMQVLSHWFASGQDPTDPATNLAVALEVWHRQGWHAWSCYR
jgi:hypothetical protein